MTKRNTAKLGNRDEVEVRAQIGDRVEWLRGYVLGDPTICVDAVYVDVQTEGAGFLKDVRHTDLR